MRQFKRDQQSSLEITIPEARPFEPYDLNAISELQMTHERIRAEKERRRANQQDDYLSMGEIIALEKEVFGSFTGRVALETHFEPIQ